MGNERTKQFQGLPGKVVHAGPGVEHVRATAADVPQGTEGGDARRVQFQSLAGKVAVHTGPGMVKPKTSEQP